MEKVKFVCSRKGIIPYTMEYVEWWVAHFSIQLSTVLFSPFD